MPLVYIQYVLIEASNLKFEVMAILWPFEVMAIWPKYSLQQLSVCRHVDVVKTTS